MAVIPFPAETNAGRKAQETGGRLINCYASEVKGAPARTVLWSRAAGLRRIADVPSGTLCRGHAVIGSVLIHLVGGQAYSVTPSGTAFNVTTLGPLNGTAPVTIAQNNAAGTPDTVCVTENGAFMLSAQNAPSAFADGDLPAVNSVAAIDGYLIFTTAGGELWSSDLNAPSVASNAFEGLPEGSLLRAVEYGNEIYAFGTWGFRVYRNAGLSPFPLDYTGVKRDVGLAGTHAIAGFQEGWADALIFAGSDGRVYRMEGYSPVPISTPEVSRAIERASERSALQASVYMVEGDAFWILTSPGEWTLEYNLTTGLWNERASYGRNDWRARAVIRAFDRWICGDAATGDVFEIVAGLGSEQGDPLVYTLYSGVLSAFPQRLNAVRSWFRFTAGVGRAAGQDPIETDPVVTIAWSRDGGATFGTPLFRRLGGEGDTDALIAIGNTGLAGPKGLQFRLTVSDPVHAAFMGGETVLEARAP